MGKKKQAEAQARAYAVRKRLRVAGLVAVGCFAVVGVGSLFDSGTVNVREVSAGTSTEGTCQTTGTARTAKYLCAPAQSPGGADVVEITSTRATYEDGFTFDQRTGTFR